MSALSGRLDAATTLARKAGTLALQMRPAPGAAQGSLKGGRMFGWIYGAAHAPVGLCGGAGSVAAACSLLLPRGVTKILAAAPGIAGALAELP